MIFLSCSLSGINEALMSSPAPGFYVPGLSPGRPRPNLNPVRTISLLKLIHWFLFFHIHSTLRLLLYREIHKPLCNLFLCQAQPNCLPCVFPSAVSLWEGGRSCQGHHHRSRRPSGEQSFSNSTLSVNGMDTVDEIMPPFWRQNQ